MPSVPDREPVDAALLAMLIAGTGKPIGDHMVPKDQPPPYAIFYAIPGGGTDGPPFAAPDADASFSYQVTSVGVTRRQARHMADLVFRTILARHVPSGAFQVSMVDPPALKVIGRRSLALGGATQEGEPPHRLWQVAEQYAIDVTPA